MTNLDSKNSQLILGLVKNNKKGTRFASDSADCISARRFLN